MDAVESLFAELERARQARRLPPVHSWEPAAIGSIDIRIARDGTWYHERRPILRQPLVDLFATVLRRDGETFYLVTPAEKLAITVEDAPFIGVRLTRDGTAAAQNLMLSNNVGDHVLIDAMHPLRMRGEGAQRAPYVEFRAGLEARLARSLYYELVELGFEREDRWLVRSGGVDHELGALDAV